MIEIEKRALLTEEKYNETLAFLVSNGEDLGADDKDVVYYIYDDKLLKLVHNMSKGNAKVSLKMNKLGDAVAVEEYEIPFEQDKFTEMKMIFGAIVSPKQIIEGKQLRRNFSYKGCEIAMKWSKDYGYHIEIEIVTEDKDKVEVFEATLDTVLLELGIIAMSNDEIKEYQRKVEEGAKRAQ